jgi:hypothetical protein
MYISCSICPTSASRLLVRPKFHRLFSFPLFPVVLSHSSLIDPLAMSILTQPSMSQRYAQPLTTNSSWSTLIGRQRNWTGGHQHRASQKRPHVLPKQDAWRRTRRSRLRVASRAGRRGHPCAPVSSARVRMEWSCSRPRPCPS